MSSVILRVKKNGGKKRKVRYDLILPASTAGANHVGVDERVFLTSVRGRFEIEEAGDK